MLFMVTKTSEYEINYIFQRVFNDSHLMAYSALSVHATNLRFFATE